MPALTFPRTPGCLRVGVVTTPAGLRQLSRATVPCDVVEVRLDHLLAAGCEADFLVSALSRRRHPVLLTLRSHLEGGAVRMTNAQRAALVVELLPLVEAIDWEHAARGAATALFRSARRRKVAIVLSSHEFQSTPPEPVLLRRLAAMTKTRPAIVKLAARTDDPDALLRLLKIQSGHTAAIPLALMGMGEHAAASRQLLPLLGARLVYGYLDAPSAPGQPHVRDLVRR